MVDVPSRTEQAMHALFDVVAKAMASGDPKPSRNETLDKLLDNIGDSDGASINIIDGDQINLTTHVGAAVSEIDGYEIVHSPRIEIVCVMKAAVDLAAKVDDLMIVIHDAIAADRTLGSVVDFADTAIAERSNLNVDGLANCKGVVLPVTLTFRSNRPF